LLLLKGVIKVVLGWFCYVSAKEISIVGSLTGLNFLHVNLAQLCHIPEELVGYFTGLFGIV
jgi:hypothetical protein